METEIICRSCGAVAEIEEYPRTRFAVCRTKDCRNRRLHAMVCNTERFNDNYEIVAKRGINDG